MEIEAAGKKIILDQAQIPAYKHLTNLQKQLTRYFKKNSTRLAIKALFAKQKPIKSLYIYGKVGRGKSMLMRHFFDNLPTDKKIHLHFNDFMQNIHRELHKLRQSKLDKNCDLISLVTHKIIGSNKVLCFDEMQVEDVADAMILQGVFSYFIRNKIVVVTTSNRHPLELYENGLQRNLFLKFINEVLLANFSVLNLDGKIDYRVQIIGNKKHYFYPINAKNKQDVLDIWQNLLNENQPQAREIEVLGRKISIKNAYKNIALFDFDELCSANLGVADYQAIAGEFSLIFLLNVPILKPEDRNEAKRLIWFIDEVYEKQIDLIVLAQSNPEEIYIKGIGAKAFKRTASRLTAATALLLS